MDSVTEDTSGLVTELNDVARDYGSYLSVDASKERQTFYNSIEEMLTKLDEFGGLVDTIRSDTTLCIDTNLQNIQSKCEEMKHLFARVDQLEAFVKVVHENVHQMEECVNKAENDMGSFSLKKMFSSIVGTKKPSQGRQNKPMFEPPDIFVTEEFINPPQPVVQVADSKPSGIESAEANNEPSGIDKETTKDESSAIGKS